MPEVAILSILLSLLTSLPILYLLLPRALLLAEFLQLERKNNQKLNSFILRSYGPNVLLFPEIPGYKGELSNHGMGGERVFLGTGFCRNLKLHGYSIAQDGQKNRPEKQYSLISCTLVS